MTSSLGSGIIEVKDDSERFSWKDAKNMFDFGSILVDEGTEAWVS